MSKWLPWNWGDNRDYSQNESGVFEIPEEIQEELEEHYDREPTEEEQEAIDDFDEALSHRSMSDRSNDVEPLIVKILRSLFG